MTGVQTCALPICSSLICDFCSSDQRFANLQLPSDSTSRWTPLLFGYTLPTIWACSGLSPVRVRPWRANLKRGLREVPLTVYSIPYFFCIANNTSGSSNRATLSVSPPAFILSGPADVFFPDVLHWCTVYWTDFIMFTEY